jgi:hypothetical protein
VYQREEAETSGFTGKVFVETAGFRTVGCPIWISKKKGFPMPIQDYMKRKAFRGYIQEMILPVMETRSGS